MIFRHRKGMSIYNHSSEKTKWLFHTIYIIAAPDPVTQRARASALSRFCMLQPRHQGPSQYKDVLSEYGDFHYKDKMVSQPSYLYNGNSFTGKTSLYWDGPQKRYTSWWVYSNLRAWHLCTPLNKNVDTYPTVAIFSSQYDCDTCLDVWYFSWCNKLRYTPYNKITNYLLPREIKS